MSDSPSRQTDERPPISAEFLARYHDRPDFLHSLFSVFLEEEPKRLTKIRAAVAAGDDERTRFFAHSLKGAAASLGLARLADAARALEYAARDGEAERTPGLLATLAAELQNVFRAMADRIGPAQGLQQ